MIVIEHGYYCLDVAVAVAVVVVVDDDSDYYDYCWSNCLMR
jgi:hypothetical protein